MALPDAFYAQLESMLPTWLSGRTVIDRGSPIVFPQWIPPQGNAPSSDAYFLMDILEAGEQPQGSYNNRRIMAMGILQITAVVPKSRGIGLALRMMEQLRPKLRDGSTNLTDQISSSVAGMRIQVPSNGRQAFGLADGWTGWQVDCTIFYDYAP
jgi:hypothetical protein